MVSEAASGSIGQDMLSCSWHGGGSCQHPSEHAWMDHCFLIAGKSPAGHIFLSFKTLKVAFTLGTSQTRPLLVLPGRMAFWLAKNC